MSVTFVNTWVGGWAVADQYVTTAPQNHAVDVPVTNVTSGHWLIAVVGWHGISQIETTVSVGDDAANYWVPIATSYSSNVALNANWAMSSGSSQWTIQSGTFSSDASLSVFGHAQSLRITPAVTSSVPFVNIAGNYVAVTPSNIYTVTAWLFSPTGYASVEVGVALENGSHTYFTSLLGAPTYVPPNTWVPVTYSTKISSAAAFAAAQILINNSPAPSNIMYLGQATLTNGNGYSANTRTTIWAAPNVTPPKNVFATPLGQVTGLNVQVYEFAGLPTWYNKDTSFVSFINSSSTLNLSVTPTQSDFIVAAATGSNASWFLSRVHTGWSSSYWSSFNNGVDTVGDTYMVTTWKTSSSPTSAFFYGIFAINTNPVFVTNTGGWVASNSTLGLSTSPVYTSATTHNMTITPNGTSTTVGAFIGNTSAPSVTVGQTYLGEAYFHTSPTVGNLSAKVSLTWLTSAHATISSVTSPVTTVFGTTSVTWWNAAVQAQAPATAAFVSLHLSVQGHPAVSKVVNVGRATVTQVSNAATSLSGTMVGIKTVPTVPVQPSSTWPSVKFEAAFGQPSGLPPDQLVWTDISDRLFSFTLDRGRQYELNALESAQANMNLRNDDGKLTPGSSAAGAFQVQVYTPIRITAQWNNKIYGIYRGYMERWPQTWEDIHYGIVPGIGVDAWAMFTTQLRSILQNEILLDDPFGYWPLDDAKGQSTAINLGTFTGNGQVPLQQITSLFGTGTTSASATFGANTMPLVGDAGTNWEVKNLTSTQGNNGWCLRYAGSYLPPLTLNPTFVWRSFPQFNGPLTVAGARSAIFTLVGSNNQPIISVWMDPGTGVHVTTWNGTTLVQTDHTPSSTFGYAANALYFLLMTPTTFTLYINGTDTLTGTESFFTNCATITLNGRTDNISHGQFANMSFSHVAVFPRPLDYSRFVTYSFSATNGMAGDFGDWRISRLLSYVGWSQAARIYGDQGNQQMSGATDIAGQDVATAINNIAQTEQALNYVDRNGYIVYRTRFHALDRTSSVTFGQNVAGGEIPYLISLSLDYDPQYVLNDIQTTHKGTPTFSFSGTANSSSSTVQINVTNLDSINRFSDRSLQVTSYFSDVNQSINLSNWLLSQYSYPHMRVAQVEVNPAALPSTFSTLLSLDIGDFVTLKMTPFGANNVINLKVMIIGIHHDVERKTGKWIMRFDIMPQQIAALQTVSLKLDDPVLGKLDAGNVIGW